MGGMTVLLGAFACAPVLAQHYPDRPVRIIVPFPAGGSTDLVARFVAPKLTNRLRQQFLVENRPGAAGQIGLAAVAQASPDGYTLLVASVHTIVVQQHKFPPHEVLVPVASIVGAPLVLVTRPDSPHRSIRELLEVLGKNPGRHNFGSSGMGSADHLAMELFMQRSGRQAVHVPYKGSGPALADLLAGHIELLFASPAATISHIRSGKLRALAVSGARRHPIAPDVGTLQDQGVRDFEAEFPILLIAPARVPRDIVERLAVEVRNLMREPDAQRLIELGFVVLEGDSRQAETILRAESQKWEHVIRQAGLDQEFGWRGVLSPPAKPPELPILQPFPSPAAQGSALSLVLARLNPRGRTVPETDYGTVVRVNTAAGASPPAPPPSFFIDADAGSLPTTNDDPALRQYSAMQCTAAQRELERREAIAAGRGHGGDAVLSAAKQAQVWPDAAERERFRDAVRDYVERCLTSLNAIPQAALKSTLGRVVGALGSQVLGTKEDHCSAFRIARARIGTARHCVEHAEVQNRIGGNLSRLYFRMGSGVSARELSVTGETCRSPQGALADACRLLAGELSRPGASVFERDLIVLDIEDGGPFPTNVAVGGEAAHGDSVLVFGANQYAALHEALSGAPSNQVWAGARGACQVAVRQGPCLLYGCQSSRSTSGAAVLRVNAALTEARIVGVHVASVAPPSADPYGLSAVCPVDRVLKDDNYLGNAGRLLPAPIAQVTQP